MSIIWTWSESAIIWICLIGTYSGSRYTPVLNRYSLTFLKFYITSHHRRRVTNASTGCLLLAIMLLWIPNPHPNPQILPESVRVGISDWDEATIIDRESDHTTPWIREAAEIRGPTCCPTSMTTYGTTLHSHKLSKPWQHLAQSFEFEESNSL